jgi:hypothetical protein
MDFAAFGLDSPRISGLEFQKENSNVDLKSIPRNLKTKYFRSMVWQAFRLIDSTGSATGNRERKE